MRHVTSCEDEIVSVRATKAYRGEQRYSSTHSSPRHQVTSIAQPHAQALHNRERSHRYPLARRLGGFRDRIGRVGAETNPLPLLDIDPSIHASSVIRPVDGHYTEWDIRPVDGHYTDWDIRPVAGHTDWDIPVTGIYFIKQILNVRPKGTGKPNCCHYHHIKR